MNSSAQSASGLAVSGVVGKGDDHLKIYVLDTCVLLHDPKAFLAFKEHDVVIPIVVLEELDNLKHDDRRGATVREVIRQLDDFVGDKSIQHGVKLPGGGMLKVDMDGENPDRLPKGWNREKPDNLIILTASRLKDTRTDRTVVLVSKDNNMRLKANSLGVTNEDYRNDNTPDAKRLLAEIVEIIVNDDAIVEIHQNPHTKMVGIGSTGLDADIIGMLYPNMPCRLTGRNARNTALAVYKKSDNAFHLVGKPSKDAKKGIVPRNDEQAFALYLAMDPTIQVVALSGQAGTGKSLMALLAGWRQVILSEYRGANVDPQQMPNLGRILVFRPTHEIGKELGFLPGTLEEKIAPWQRPTLSNLALLAEKFTGGVDHDIARLMQDQKIEILPINHIRGDTANHTFMIVDDAQNLTPHEMKAIITRVGQGTKVIINGDLEQVDVSFLGPTSNGFAHVISKFHGWSKYAHLRLTKGERSEVAEYAAKIL